MSRTVSVRERQTIETLHPMYVTSSKALPSGLFVLPGTPPVGLTYRKYVKEHYLETAICQAN